MIPFLAYPLALLALASVPTLAVIYIFLHRFRRRQVSSLILWRFQTQSREGGSRVRRLQLPWLFFLELLVLLLLVAAAAGPMAKLPQATRPMVVVLDDSLSMRAVADGRTARDRAEEFLEETFRLQRPPSIQVLLARGEPQLMCASDGRGFDLEPVFRGWTCWAPSSALGSAVRLASELGGSEANILVLTDRAPSDAQRLEAGRLQWRAFGRPASNIGIVNATRTAYGDQDRCLLEIDNASAHTMRAGVSARAGTNSIQQTAVTLNPGERQRIVFNVPRSTPMLEAELTPDALTEDNRVLLLPAARKQVRVRVSVADPDLGQLLDRALAATGLRAAISENPDLVIHQSDALDPGSNGWSLTWVVPAEPVACTGPFIMDRDHPLTRGMGLEGAVWAAAPDPNATGTVPLILAGNTALISSREDILGRQFLRLNLNIALSTIQTTPDWPVLFWNLLSWRAAQLPGLLESNQRLGTPARLNAVGERVLLTGPDGETKTFDRPGRQLALETHAPGLYSVVQGRSTNLLAVNFLAADESDLKRCSSGAWGGWELDARQRLEQRPLTWLFALAALGFLTLHLWLLQERVAAPGVPSAAEEQRPATG